MPRLSVIVPVYNVERWLREALDSLLTATKDEDAQIVCVNDGATDRSGEMLRGYAARFPARIMLIEQENGGYGRAVNAGLDAAAGDNIAIFEPDDRVAPDAYSAPLALLDATPGADIVRAPFLEWVDGRVRRQVGLTDPPAGAFTAFDHPPALFMTPAIWSSVFRRRALEGLRLPETRGAGYQDTHLSAALMLAGAGLVWSDRPFYYYRMDRPGASRAERSRTTEIFGIFDRIERDIPAATRARPDFAELWWTLQFLRLIWFMFRVAPGFQEEAFKISHARFSPLWADPPLQRRVARHLTPFQRRVFGRFARGRADAFRRQFGQGAPLPDSVRAQPDFDLADVMRTELWSLPWFARASTSRLAPLLRATVNPSVWLTAQALRLAARARG